MSDFSKGTVWAGESATRSDPSVYRRPDGGDEAQIVAEVAAVEADILHGRYKTLTNAESGSLVAGSTVYLFSATSVKNTTPASALATSYCLGLVADASIAASAAGRIQVNGEVTLTTAEWDAIAGTTGGLTAGTVYYASATTPGALTSTLPATTGNFDVTVGIALSATTMLLRQQTAPVAHA